MLWRKERVADSRSEDGDGWIPAAPNHGTAWPTSLEVSAQVLPREVQRNIPRNKTCSAPGRIAWPRWHADVLLQVIKLGQNDKSSKHAKWEYVEKDEPYKSESSSW